jgi:hypothetical protein
LRWVAAHAAARVTQLSNDASAEQGRRGRDSIGNRIACALDCHVLSPEMPRPACPMPELLLHDVVWAEPGELSPRLGAGK